jgi:hypothetical protein
MQYQLLEYQLLNDLVELKNLLGIVGSNRYFLNSVDGGCEAVLDLQQLALDVHCPPMQGRLAELLHSRLRTLYGNMQRFAEIHHKNTWWASDFLETNGVNASQCREGLDATYSTVYIQLSNFRLALGQMDP